MMTKTIMTKDEQEMLLGRRVEGLLTHADREHFRGQVCLITGAGGSVGSELARQIAMCDPALLVLVDHSEHALFTIERHLAEQAPGTPIEPVLCDITRASSVSRLLRRVQPHVVFHAAAYKHVTMAEDHACAAARVNVLGTCALLAAAREVGARFVLMSSDKAAAPRSVMGATKRLAELAVLAEQDLATRPVVVRFGNVLASSGSFVEVMRERIRQGQPLLVTDPDATRFFMTVTEAASLVMKASTIGRGGETFWLDMGSQVRIGDLTERLMRVARLQGLPPVPVRVVGLRPGEKLTEELASQGTFMERTRDHRIWVARQKPINARQSLAWIRTLRRAVVKDDAVGVLNVLTSAVHDFAASDRAWATAHEIQAGPASVQSRARRAPRIRRVA